MKAFKYNLNNYIAKKFNFAPMGVLMCVLLLMLAFPPCSIGQIPGDSILMEKDTPIDNFAYMEWSSSKKLTYSDFKRQVNISSSLASRISVTVEVDVLKSDNDSLVLRVVAQFDKYGSGIDSLKDVNKVELKYARDVFVILEIYARKLRKALINSPPISQSDDSTVGTLMELNKQQGEQAWADYNADINGYSPITIDTAAQSEYEMELKQELDSLDEYKKPIIRIKYTKK